MRRLRRSGQRRPAVIRVGLILVLAAAALVVAALGVARYANSPDRPLLASGTEQSPTTTPVIEAGSVTTVTAAGALSKASGVTAVGGSVFVAEGSRIMRIDPDTGATSVLAGSTISSCQDAATGSAARFGSAKVVGTDGRYIYVTDNCGLRRVDPDTGTTTTVTNSTYDAVAIAGNVLYGRTYYDLYRHDLNSGTRTRIAPGWVASNTLAADESHLWSVSAGTLTRIDPATGQATTVSSSLPMDGPGSALSVGDFLYVSFSNPVAPGGYPSLIRIAKADGASLVIHAAAANASDPPIWNITGIASDGAKLWVSDSATSGHAVKSITPATPPPFATPAPGPVVDAGALATVTAPGALSGANGLTMLTGSAFVADGTRLMAVNPDTGATSVVAGSTGTSSCLDAATGSAVKFFSASGYNLKVVGTDGRYIYVTDYCGLRRVDPGNGATTTVTTTKYDAVAIAGSRLFARNYYDLYRHDLNSGTRTRIAPGSVASTMVADESYLWSITSGTLTRIDQATGQTLTVTSSLPGSCCVSPSAAVSVGDYVYVSFRDPGPSGASRFATVTRISKSTGAWQLTAGGGVSAGDEWPSKVTGLASDGARLYITDSASTGGSLMRINPVDAPTFPAPETAPVMQAGSVSTLTSPGALSGPMGVAIVGGTPYVGDVSRVLRVNPYTGATSVLAGSTDTSTCLDAPTGSAARFYSPVRVVGSDGRFIYVSDNCGLRAVDAETGATQTLTTTKPSGVSIAGGYLYMRESSQISRRDLRTGATATLAQGTNGPIAADADYLWTASNTTLTRINFSTGEQVAVTGTLPHLGVPSAILSVGGYLYVTVGDTSCCPTYRSILRINKTTGQYDSIVGSTSTGFADGVSIDAGFGSMSGIGTDGTRLYVTDSSATYGRWLRVVRAVKLPTYDGGPSLWRETIGGTNPSEQMCNAACHADPVQTDTGALFMPATDVTVPGHGIPLVMVRTYSSAAATTTSPVGYGWAWPHGMTLAQPANQPGHVHITQENGSVVTFVQQGDGSFKAAPRVRATLVRNGDGTWTFIRNQRHTIAFTAAGRLLRQTDANGNTSAYTYNSSGRLERVTDHAGRSLNFTYDTSGWLATVATPMGRTVTYTHNATGDLTSVTDPTGTVTNYSYDANHLMTSVTSPRGAVTSNVYDSARRVIEQTDPTGGVTTFEYVDGDQVGTSTVTVTGPDGTKTVEQYVDGQLRFQTRAAGTTEAATTTWVYDPATSQPTRITCCAPLILSVCASFTVSLGWM